MRPTGFPLFIIHRSRDGDLTGPTKTPVSFYMRETHPFPSPIAGNRLFGEKEKTTHENRNGVGRFAHSICIGRVH